MDLEKIGKFITEQRTNKKLTQKELANRLNVTNKAVSKWENGRSMPDVGLFENLCSELDITLNELLSGKKLSTEEYKEMAETNIKESLKASAFDLKEKQIFLKKKWRREHLATITACTAAWLVLLIALKLQGVETYLLGTIGGQLAVLYYVVLNNRMTAYVENHIYGGKWDENKNKDEEKQI